jgi:hypothetical protein
VTTIEILYDLVHLILRSMFEIGAVELKDADDLSGIPPRGVRFEHIQKIDCAIQGGRWDGSLRGDPDLGC